MTVNAQQVTFALADSRADVHFISFLFAIGLWLGLKIIY